VVAYLAQRTDKATITRLLRCSWQAVAAVVTRVVAGHLDGTRLEGLDRIGIDEVSDRKGHRYLTVVADHDRDGAVVWPVGACPAPRWSASSTPRRCAHRPAAGGVDGPARRRCQGHPGPCPTRAVGADPSTSSSWPTTAVDEVRRAAWNSTRRAAGVAGPGPLARARPGPAAQLVKNTRWALLRDPAGWTDQQRQAITKLRRARQVLFRAWR
jgi:transposase